MTALDPSADRPLSDQLADLLRGEINSGARSQGSQLPSERDFEQDYGVSRTVVRDALAELVLEGIVVKRKGHGSFVRRQLPVRRIVLAPEKVPVVLTARMPTPDERRRLGLDPGVPVVQVAGETYAADRHEFVVEKVDADATAREDAEDAAAIAQYEQEVANGTLRTVSHQEARERLDLPAEEKA